MRARRASCFKSSQSYRGAGPAPTTAWFPLWPSLGAYTMHLNGRSYANWLRRFGASVQAKVPSMRSRRRCEGGEKIKLKKKDWPLILVILVSKYYSNVSCAPMCGHPPTLNIYAASKIATIDPFSRSFAMSSAVLPILFLFF